MRYVKGLLLPKPDGSYLHRLATISPNIYLKIPDQIRATTKLAKRYNVPVRWFDDFIGMGILFCNPDEPNAWAHIELSIPSIESENKLTIRIERSSHPQTYLRIYAAFKKMWEESATPDLGD